MNTTINNNGMLYLVDSIVMVDSIAMPAYTGINVAAVSKQIENFKNDKKNNGNTDGKTNS